MSILAVFLVKFIVMFRLDVKIIFFLCLKQILYRIVLVIFIVFLVVFFILLYQILFIQILIVLGFCGGFSDKGLEIISGGYLLLKMIEVVGRMGEENFELWR